jgi:penicillin V acylase-like amidase (Ntn superfamily)
MWMIFKQPLFFLGFLLSGIPNFSCTTFLLSQDGQYVFGRNYDWVTGSGLVATNLRGIQKFSFTESGKNLKWVSRYGSITFNQYGKEFPTGGMNEKGLVVELMWLDGSVYPKPDHRPGLGVLQWIQFQLDNSATIDEVVATDELVRIDEDGNTPLHYLIADSTGKAAAIEFLNGKMVVHSGDGLPYAVLTNTRYDYSLEAVKDVNTGNLRSPSGIQDNSLERFAHACSMVRKLGNAGKVTLVDYAFNILNKVSQGDFTKWSIVYDISKRKIHFRTEENTRIRIVDFKSFDFDCTSLSKVIDINGHASGNIAQLFETFNSKLNREIIEKSIAESSSRVPIPDAIKEKLVKFPERLQCQ